MVDLVERLGAALGDRYLIERELGSGGMAIVYLAEDRRHGRRVALKVLRPELAESVGADRVLREIEFAARLTHQHILALYDSGAADGFLYYVMPYVEGESLRQKLNREGQLEISEALRLGLARAYRASWSRDGRPWYWCGQDRAGTTAVYELTLGSGATREVVTFDPMRPPDECVRVRNGVLYYSQVELDADVYVMDLAFR